MTFCCLWFGVWTINDHLILITLIYFFFTSAVVLGFSLVLIFSPDCFNRCTFDIDKTRFKGSCHKLYFSFLFFSSTCGCRHDHIQVCLFMKTLYSLLFLTFYWEVHRISSVKKHTQKSHNGCSALSLIRLMWFKLVFFTLYVKLLPILMRAPYNAYHNLFFLSLSN